MELYDDDTTRALVGVFSLPRRRMNEKSHLDSQPKEALSFATRFYSFLPYLFSISLRAPKLDGKFP